MTDPTSGSITDTAEELMGAGVLTPQFLSTAFTTGVIPHDARFTKIRAQLYKKLVDNYTLFGVNEVRSNNAARVVADYYTESLLKGDSLEQAEMYALHAGFASGVSFPRAQKAAEALTSTYAFRRAEPETTSDKMLVMFNSLTEAGKVANGPSYAPDASHLKVSCMHFILGAVPFYGFSRAQKVGFFIIPIPLWETVQKFVKQRTGGSLAVPCTDAQANSVEFCEMVLTLLKDNTGQNTSNAWLADILKTASALTN